jgi:hypothetical protein
VVVVADDLVAVVRERATVAVVFVVKVLVKVSVVDVRVAVAEVWVAVVELLVADVIVVISLGKVSVVNVGEV